MMRFNRMRKVSSCFESVLGCLVVDGNLGQGGFDGRWFVEPSGIFLVEAVHRLLAPVVDLDPGSVVD